LTEEGALDPHSKMLAGEAAMVGEAKSFTLICNFFVVISAVYEQACARSFTLVHT
jgi:hypothetical protein